ncbi:MAG: ABC transporter permease [Clostridiales bacterium]|nr:ABC transporter permease [Clostridiales bacterium]
MWRYILKRLVMMIFVVLGVAIVIFSIMYFIPGNPVQIILGSNASEESIQELYVSMGLDQPYLTQLGTFLSDTFLHFDLGTSYQSKIAVATEIAERFPRTLIIAACSLIVTTAVGIPLGIVAATHQGKWQDNVATLISMPGLSLPGFWLALMLVNWLSVGLGILPAYGVGTWKHYVIPIISNSVIGIANIGRRCRVDVLEVIHSDYVTTARAKGVSNHNVTFKHVMPNALIPLITSLGSVFASSLGGTVVIESIFVIPGIGLYMSNGILNLDYPAVRGGVVVIAIAFSFVMLAVDLIYAYVDPRIKAQCEGK